MRATKINLPKILLDSKQISPEDWEKALSLQKKTGKPLAEILVKENFISEEEMIAILSHHLFIPFIDVNRFNIEKGVVGLIPEEITRKYCFLPLWLFADILLIAVAEPLDIIALDNLRIILGYEIKQVLGKEKDIIERLNTCYKKQPQSLTTILDYNKPTEREAVESIIEESRKQPIVEAVNLIINEAINKRASDIHLEPEEEGVLVRYRIDGMLQEAHRLPSKSQRGIAARLKILSGLDITKFYIPQDGRFHIQTQGKEIDFRVSTLPTLFGEKFVLRILDKRSIFVKLEDLGFSPQPLSLVKEAIEQDHGMLLITGPTGSGKSTTLYAILMKLNTIKRHIVTIEDPVEYQIDGITQVQVRPDIGLSFATALRGLLRQSPDTVLVGEIRDRETADIAIKASLIGQLILSTLHTNDAIGAFARLVDMGVERYLVASSLILICAQRLCRRICENCKEPVHSLSEEVLREMGLEADKKLSFYKGRGCAECNYSGYKGRVPLLEALKVEDKIKEMVIKEVAFEEIKEWAIREGKLITLRRDGIDKALAGITTLEEVYRVTARD
ncbi:MAG: type II secretion system protein GspE [Candidatus Omnitrophota bacterium]|nr:MAG: type II secretion system protein GspE [Candidatus Omnitrophota bacterium]